MATILKCVSCINSLSTGSQAACSCRSTSQNFTITCVSCVSENSQSLSLEEIANEVLMGQNYLDLTIDIQGYWNKHYTEFQQPQLSDDQYSEPETTTTLL